MEAATFILPEEQSLIQSIKTLYEYHKKQAEKYEKMLLVAGEHINGSSFPINSQQSGTVGHRIKDAIVPLNHTKVAFEDFIITLFRDLKPRNVHQIMSAYRDISNKPILRKDFASKLSGLKRKGIIESQLLKIGNKYQSQHVWGLIEWFNDNQMRDIYLETYKIENGLIG